MRWLAMIALLPLACGACGGKTRWVHSSADRSLAADSAACEGTAAERTLVERAGRPESVAEQQTFTVAFRRHFGHCMREEGWEADRSR